jgi:hypothetical protein
VPNQTFSTPDCLFSLAFALEPEAREAFVEAAVAAIAAMPPGRLGEGSAHRALRPIFRKHFTPPNLPEPAEDVDEFKIDRRATRYRAPSAGVPRPCEFEGAVYPSRAALAAVIAPRCGGRDASAVSVMLLKLNFDAAAVIAHYAARTIRFEGREFPNRNRLAEHIAPRCGCAVSTVAWALERFGDDGASVIDHYQRKRR